MKQDEKKVMMGYKKEYIPPAISVEIIELEYNLANTSTTTITPGGNNGVPNVEDWEENKDEQNWEF
ncbi:hypothetical protein CMU93_00580 [Elizabethkingia anophelis]|nr:hypothetical protein [Elizabethkingia anophelis]